MERIRKLKPLYIYFIGATLSILSGIVVKPFNETEHNVVCVIALGICIFGIYRHLKD